MFILAGICTDEMSKLIGAVKYIVQIIQFAVPVMLILWGILDMTKAITAGKEEEIKKFRKALVDRVIAAVLVLIIPFVVMTLMGLVGSTDWKTCWTNSKANISNLLTK